jgi:CCR4-NOT transcriptional regulation complex NOT5 subunit
MIPGAALLIRKQRAVREMQFELAEWTRREERLLMKKPLDEGEKEKDDVIRRIAQAKERIKKEIEQYEGEIALLKM